MRKFLSLCGLLLALCVGSIAHATTVTISGTWLNAYGNACVYCHVDVYALDPSIVPSGDLISTNTVQTITDSSGAFSLDVQASMTVAVFLEETNALFKVTLPASGSLTLSQIQALQPSLLTSFPPGRDLDMGGYTFTNVAGATASGEMATTSDSGFVLNLGSPKILSSGVYAFPTGATYVEVFVQGGSGAGGGGYSGATYGGGGGGSGATAICMFKASGGNLTVALGSGGTGGSSGSPGGDGGVTTVVQAGTTCTGDYGRGGAAGTSSSQGAGGAGGAAGTGFIYSGCTTPYTPTCITEQSIDGDAGETSPDANGGTGGTGGGGHGGQAFGGSGSGGVQGKAIAWTF